MSEFKQGNFSDNWPDEIVAYTDGASRGNPGDASLGVHIVDKSESETIYQYSKYLGEQTNNYAEYKAVIQALEFAVQKGVASLTLKSDSQLLVRQLSGQYKVKSETLRPLFLECKELEGQIEKCVFVHVKRELNKKADALANYILDTGTY